MPIKFIRIINAYKAHHRRVFDYMDTNSFLNPTDRHVELISNICDGCEVFEADSLAKAQKRMREGDYLYQCLPNGEKTLVSIYPPKTSK